MEDYKCIIPTYFNYVSRFYLSTGSRTIVKRPLQTCRMQMLMTYKIASYIIASTLLWHRDIKHTRILHVHY